MIFFSTIAFGMKKKETLDITATKQHIESSQPVRCVPKSLFEDQLDLEEDIQTSKEFYPLQNTQAVHTQQLCITTNESLVLFPHAMNAYSDDFYFNFDKEYLQKCNTTRFTRNNNTVKRKRFNLQTQKKKQRMKTSNGEEMSNIQEKYLFKCLYCDSNRSFLYRYVLNTHAKKHFTSQHSDLCFDDASMTKYIKNCVQYPEKVIEFSTSCPNCEKTFRVIDQACGLIRKLSRHFIHCKNNDENISHQNIINHLTVNRQYKLVPNPYLLEQYIYKSHPQSNSKH